MINLEERDRIQKNDLNVVSSHLNQKNFSNKHVSLITTPITFNQSQKELLLNERLRELTKIYTKLIFSYLF